MSSDPPDRWMDQDLSSNPEPLPPPVPPPGTGPDGKGLKGMLADAMAKSRGQGVVQGSTLFFKNLAESVAHSNRNLKIGLAFLMAAFVVVASGLGYLVFQAFQVQEQTKTSLESQVKNLDEKTQKALEPFLVRARELDERMAQMETRHRQELDAMRLNVQQEVDIARAEVASLRAEMKDGQGQVKAHDVWIRDATERIQSRFGEFAKRLEALESKR